MKRKTASWVKRARQDDDTPEIVTAADVEPIDDDCPIVMRGRSYDDVFVDIEQALRDLFEMSKITGAQVDRLTSIAAAHERRLDEVERYAFELRREFERRLWALETNPPTRPTLRSRLRRLFARRGK